MPQLSITTMQFTCSSQVKLRGCIAPSGTLSSQALVHGVNRLSVFGLGGGGVSLQAAGNHPVEKIIIAGTKYQASLSHHQLGRRASYVFGLRLLHFLSFSCSAHSSSLSCAERRMSEGAILFLLLRCFLKDWFLQ